MNTYMTEGVGKRIVDALKKQSEVDLVTKTVEPEEVVAPTPEPVAVAVEPEHISTNAPEQVFNFENSFVNPQPAFNGFVPQQPEILQQNPMYSAPINNNFSELNNLEVPANVAVLRQLITQLPSGVSRQAGALVIKQTMEALGISMKAVLSEAQQLQENLNASARDCQNSILECKKQINTLEAQVSMYQKQSASLNDIVSLFLQLN